MNRISEQPRCGAARWLGARLLAFVLVTSLTLGHAIALPTSPRMNPADLPEDRDTFLLAKYGLLPAPGDKRLLPLLREAVTKKLTRSGQSATAAQVEQELDRITTTSEAALELVPSLIQVSLTALKSPNRTATQQAFYDYFQAYYARETLATARRTLSAWNAYRSRSRQAPTGTTFSVLTDTGPSHEDFVPPANPLGLGEAGVAGVAEFYKPLEKDMTAQEVRDWIGAAETASGAVPLPPGGGLLIASGTMIYDLVLAGGDLADAQIGEIVAGMGVTAATEIAGLAGAAAGPLIILSFTAQILIKKTSEVAQTEAYDSVLNDAVDNPDMHPDLYAMLTPGQHQSANLCYPWCREGYTGQGPVCWQDCQEGYTDDGAFCRKPHDITNRDSYHRDEYPWKFGDGLNDAGMWSRCESDHGSGNCEKDDAVVYAKCRAGYEAAVNYCWQSCPAGYTNDGATCRRDADIYAKETYGRGVGVPEHDDCVTADLRQTHAASIFSYLVRMMVGGPADAGTLYARYEPPHAGIADGYYALKVQHSGQCLGISGGNNTPGSQAVQWPCGTHDNLTFLLQQQPDGSYEIRAKHSDQCLNVSGGNNTPGAQVIQNPCQGADNERFWLRRRVNGTVEIIAKHSGLALAVEGAYQTNAARVIQWDNYPEPHFEWAFEPVLADGYYALKVQHSGQCLGISGGNNTPGSQAVQWPCGTHDNLTFLLQQQPDGSYEIRAKHSDQCLNVSGGNNTPGAQVIQNPCQGADNERFWLRRRVNGTVEIIAKHSGLALAVEGAYQTNAARVIQWDNYPEPHFEWTFELVHR